MRRSFEYLSKVEQISEDSLDLISSPLPLVKIKTIEGDGIESRLPFKIFSTLNETKFGKNEPPVSTKIVVVNCLQLNPVPMTPLGPFSYMIPQLLVTID